MKIIQYYCLFLLIISNIVPIYGADDLIVIPLPDLPEEQYIKLHVVHLGVEAVKDEMASRLVKLGSRTGEEYRESLTSVTLSGSFISPHKGRQRSEWSYYLGVTEITEAQWFSIMGVGKKSLLPKTRITFAEVETFFEKLNTYVYENHKDVLPKINGVAGYFRLPTEVEWEFAARGGAAVDSVTFDMDHPYGDNGLGKSEWSVSNSRGKAKKVGVLKPNPVGLYDMLGNVKELTMSGYSLEYGHGQVSGRVARGGHAKENLDDLRASKRTEILPLLENGEARRDPMLGFRLALVTSIFTKDDDAMASAWSEYSKVRPVGTMERSSQIVDAAQTREVEDALNIKIVKLEGQIQALKENKQHDAAERSVAKKPLVQGNGLKKENELLRVSLQKLKEDNLALSRENADSERKRVTALIRTSSAAAHLAYNDNLRIKALSGIKNFKDKVDARIKTREDNLRVYRHDVIELSEASPQIVAKELREWIVKSRDVRKASPQQIEAVQVLAKHVKIFRAGRLLNTDVLLEDINRGIN